VAGASQFVGDVRLPGLVHLAVVRSAHAHARLRKVDTSRAAAASGLIDVFSAAEIGPWLHPLASTRPFPPDVEPYRQLALARDKVRYVGEPLAAVVAETLGEAEDAAALVEVEVEELPVVVTVGSGTPVHTVVKEAGRQIAEIEAQAHLTVEATLRVGRDTGMPMETRGLIVVPDDDGGVTLFGVAKLPAFVRAAIAQVLDLSPNLVRIHPVSIGGGFGVRGELYAEDVIAVVAAVRTRRPVAWIEDRTDHLVGANHSRETVWRLRASVAADGSLLALSGQVDVDAGAYVRTLVPADLYATELMGPYRVPAYCCEVRTWLTNKMGIGTMRAPGTFESSFAREMLFERIAARLQLTGEEFRRRNLLGPSELPLAPGFDLLGSPVVYDSADLPHAFHLAAEAIEAMLPTARAQASAAGRRVGAAVVPVILPTGIGPFEAAHLVVERPGVVVVYTATTSMGQGHETSLAQIAADAIGVSMEAVVVREGDPATVPRSVGTFASRSIATAGSAVWNAGLKLRELLKDLLGDGLIDLERALSLSNTPIEATERFEIPTLTYAYGAHGAVVELDPELGTVCPLRYVVVADPGRVVNPAIVHDQLAGAAAFGIGGALLQSIDYSADGQPLTMSFLDYLLPTVMELPEVEVVLVDRARSRLNPLGVKGAGEIGTAGAGAAIAVAAQDALGRDGAWIEKLPLQPARLAGVNE